MESTSMWKSVQKFLTKIGVVAPRDEEAVPVGEINANRIVAVPDRPVCPATPAPTSEAKMPHPRYSQEWIEQQMGCISEASPDDPLGLTAEELQLLRDFRRFKQTQPGPFFIWRPQP